MDRIDTALFDPSFPVNPIPFAKGLADLIREEGTDAIQTDKAKRILWVLIAQSYGQLGSVNLTDEWTRLFKAFYSNPARGEETVYPKIRHWPDLERTVSNGPGQVYKLSTVLSKASHQVWDEYETYLNEGRDANVVNAITAHMRKFFVSKQTGQVRGYQRNTTYDTYMKRN